MGWLLSIFGPVLLRFGLGFLIPDYKAKAARLQEQLDIMEKADEKRESDRKHRLEAVRDARSGNAAGRLFDRYKRK